MAKYLDSTGLTYLWGKIVAAFQAKVTASGLLKGDGSGGVTAATAGTDYAAASHNQALSTITGAEDIQAIEALTGTSGLLKKTAANTWSLDTTSYQTALTNPVTGTGTSGYLAKFNGGTSVTNGPALGSATTTFLRNDGSWATPSNTTYSAGTGLSLSSTTFNHASSVTAGTAGTSSATSGSTLAVPYVTYNATGHVTAAGTHTHTVTGFAASSHNHAASNITSGTLDIARIPTSNTQSNSTSTVPTSALVYSMNETMSTMGWTLVGSWASTAANASYMVPVSSLAGKCFVKVVVNNTTASAYSFNISCGFATSNGTNISLSDCNISLMVAASTSLAWPYFVMDGGTGTNGMTKQVITLQPGNTAATAGTLLYAVAGYNHTYWGVKPSKGFSGLYIYAM